MTQILAALFIILFFTLVFLLKSRTLSRYTAFTLLSAAPLISNIPTGFFYGWGSWPGTVKGFGISLVTIFALALIQTRRRRSGGFPFVWLLGLYALPLMLSIFAARMWLPTAFVWWQFATLVPVFIAVAGEGSQPKIREAIFLGFALGLTYQALYSVYQKLNGVTQAAGTFGHQNILGLATEFALLPLLAMAFIGQRNKVIYLGIVSGLVCVAGSGSRATMGIVGAVFVLMIVLSLMRNLTPQKITSAGVGLLLLALAVPFALGTLNDRFQGENFMVEDAGRIQFELAAKAMAADNPIGVGANNYAFVSNTEGYADRFELGWQLANRSVPVHHAYLAARAETGRFGEIVFMGILGIPFITALILAFRSGVSSNGDYLLGYAMALLANIIHNAYEYAVHTLHIQALLLIVIGLISSEVRFAKFQKIRRRHLKQLARWYQSDSNSSPKDVESGVHRQV